MAKKMNYEKRFYQKILKAIDREDKNAFYKEFNNAIKSGKMTVSQTRSKQQLSFDATWIHVISGYMKNLAKIVNNPRIYMQAEENVTPIQSAKKINARSVQHLSSHVQLVHEIREDGTIVPNKVLSTTYEDTMNIYENRFIMTLISKIAAFVEVRYNQITGGVDSYKIDHLKINDSFKWRNYDVDATIDLKVKEKVDDEVSKKNMELVDEILTIRAYTRGFMQSAFYQTMKESGARPVTPPILRTNIITKSVDYNSCLKLWLFLDSYRELGINIGVLDKELEFDNDFIDDVCDMIMLDYSLIAMNQEDREKTYELYPYKYRKEKEARVDTEELVVEEQLDTSDLRKANPPSISEYYYQKMKTNFKSEFTKQVNSGISYKRSFLTIYRRMLKIENGVQKEILSGMEQRLKKQYPTKVKSAAKLTYLKREKAIYQQVLMVKQADVSSIEAHLRQIEKDLKKYEAQIPVETQKLRKKQRAKALKAEKKENKDEETQE